MKKKKKIRGENVNSTQKGISLFPRNDINLKKWDHSVQLSKSLKPI